MSGDDATPVIGQPAAERHWRGRVRCGICGHERVVDPTADQPLDLAQRYTCDAGCIVVIDGKSGPRLSCYQVQG